MTTNKKFTNLFSFSYTNGAFPSPLVFGDDGAVDYVRLEREGAVTGADTDASDIDLILSLSTDAARTASSAGPARCCNHLTRPSPRSAVAIREASTSPTSTSDRRPSTTSFRPRAGSSQSTARRRLISTPSWSLCANCRGVSTKDRDRKNIVHSTRDGVYGFRSSIDEVNVKELLCCNAGEL